MMNKDELIEYKSNLQEELKKAKAGLKRVKLDLIAKKLMIKLVEDQIKEFEGAFTGDTGSMVGKSY